ncbi:MAG: hypothetical protein IKL89_03840 [Clostridia bacterium]|nr:hypothetical protein [Clostridia bacterium]
MNIPDPATLKEKIRAHLTPAFLRELDVPPVYISLACGLLAFFAGETGKGIVTLVGTLLFTALWIAARKLRGPDCGAELPRGRRMETEEYVAALSCGALAVVFGIAAVISGLPVFGTLRDIFGGLGVALGLARAERIVVSSSFALNLRLLRGDETLENTDDPYVLGNADVAVINPDVFSRSDLLPPKFFYAGEVRHMGALDAADQRHLLHAVMSCLGDGVNINSLSELRLKHSKSEAAFRILEQREENGMTVSRERQGETPVNFLKGSCGDIAPRCTHFCYQGSIAPMTREELESIAKARLVMKNRGCRPFAYAMHTPGSNATVFLGIVGFGLSREGDLRRTVTAMREAGLDVCFAGTGGREMIFGLAEMSGLSVTRFMTGRELSGRNIPPDNKEIVSHRLFAEISSAETEHILEAFRAEKHRPAYIGTREIACGGSSVQAAFSGRESCEKLLLCIKMRRNAERAAQGFAAARLGILAAGILWPVLCGITTRSFAACMTPAAVLFCGIFGWVAALCVSLMYKNSETPKEMGRDRQRSRNKRVFSTACWILSVAAASVPLISVPLMYPEQAGQALSLAVAAILLSTPLQVFSYGVGISISPSGLLRRHPAAYAAVGISLVLTLLFFSLPALAGACGFAAVSLGAWRMSVPFALVPVLCLGVFLFLEWVKDPSRYAGGEVR